MAKLTNNFNIRKISEEDIPEVYNLCSKNSLYYQYCPPFVSYSSIRSDMEALPPGKTHEDKCYVGYYENGKLIAVMDMILGYPDSDTKYIGFFMTDVAEQGKGLGSIIIKDFCASSCIEGFANICLGWVKGNPQAEHFWHKNGFRETGKVYEMDDYSVVEAIRTMIVQVSDKNIKVAASIHSISWKESHRSFCNTDFIERHSVENQLNYIVGKVEKGSEFFIFYDQDPVAVVSINGKVIEDLYVLPEYQNKGYGTQLLGYAVAKIQGHGLKPSLWILENNLGAERLYLRNGFVPSGNRNHITGKLDEVEYIHE
ncbi:GNAT family N-acetyltransferase [Butyrivibrio sp. XPD2006]|uniref:GNAT family N-acetyltransferase n=1 Tax=Butyrivibrio sp. XPD2006 TaxID=1280668 RepID=UPI0003B54E88|nr:GNAT family N-acetyltransferase [Butyrivibrio sp. XPD2006]